MNIRDALIQQSPSLALQRAAADEIARLDAQLKELKESTMKLKLTYPPQFDGELHIDVKTGATTDRYVRHQITFTVSALTDEPITDVIRRIGWDLHTKPIKPNLG